MSLDEKIEIEMPNIKEAMCMIREAWPLKQ
jgi:hypothetical protein